MRMRRFLFVSLFVFFSTTTNADPVCENLSLSPILSGVQTTYSATCSSQVTSASWTFCNNWSTSAWMGNIGEDCTRVTASYNGTTYQANHVFYCDNGSCERLVQFRAHDASGTTKKEGIISVSVPGESSFMSLELWSNGVGGFWTDQQWLTGDFNGDGYDDVANAFNYNGLARIYVRPSNGVNSFGIQTWASQLGGFWSGQIWMTGDFNGDGKDDIAKAWNSNGQTNIDIYVSNGSSFTLQRWVTQLGWFSSTQKWLVGDFNGDGLADIAKGTDDNGLANIDIYVSTGNSFSIQRWATQLGGFSSAQKWISGDFNGDGKSDIGKAWNNDGYADIDVYTSTGSQFGIQRWANKLGGFTDEQKWFGGDFNGDGKDDIAKVFYDYGNASVDVYPSSGTSFAAQRWVTQMGGYWTDQRWKPGDFNGDGKDDITRISGENDLAKIYVFRTF